MRVASVIVRGMIGIWAVLLFGPLFAAERPNIVFLLADDLGFTDVGFHGSEIQTPNIDRLANAGVKLEAFYVQPVCSPTRAALMTGRYPSHYGLQVGVVRPWAQYGLPLEEQTLPQGLKTAGYETAICGKWHLGHFQQPYLPMQRGFDHQYGHYNGALDYFTHIRDGGFDWHRNDRVNRDEGYTTVLLGNEATSLINQHNFATPLFLYVPFNAPHTPLQALPEHLEIYKDIKDKQRRTYAAMVHCVDEQVGRIAEAIATKGQTTETLFIFSSDNGGPTKLGATNGKLRAGKGTLYEGGTRVAAFATWSGHLPAGTECHEPLHMVDWYPTLMKLTGATVDQKLPLDGKDAWATIVGKAPSPHEEILLNTTPTNGAIRVGGWKLVIAGGQSTEDQEASNAKQKKGKKSLSENDGVELFDLTQDLSEEHNLAKQHPDKVRELKARLNVYAQAAAAPKSAPKAKDFRVPAIWGE
ncbi:sulfatase-like hydrolase/transferase [bacterium]|nr:sulfatase-like hydrolase/transferase [bacterium]